MGSRIQVALLLVALCAAGAWPRRAHAQALTLVPTSPADRAWLEYLERAFPGSIVRLDVMGEPVEGLRRQLPQGNVVVLDVASNVLRAVRVGTDRVLERRLDFAELGDSSYPLLVAVAELLALPELPPVPAPTPPTEPEAQPEAEPEAQPDEASTATGDSRASEGPPSSATIERSAESPAGPAETPLASAPGAAPPQRTASFGLALGYALTLTGPRPLPFHRPSIGVHVGWGGARWRAVAELAFDVWGRADRTTAAGARMRLRRDDGQLALGGSWRRGRGELRIHALAGAFVTRVAATLGETSDAHRRVGLWLGAGVAGALRLVGGLRAVLQAQLGRDLRPHTFTALGQPGFEEGPRVGRIVVGLAWSIDPPP